MATTFPRPCSPGQHSTTNATAVPELSQIALLSKTCFALATKLDFGHFEKKDKTHPSEDEDQLCLCFGKMQLYADENVLSFINLSKLF